MKRTALSSFYVWLFIGWLVLAAAGLSGSPVSAATAPAEIKPSAEGASRIQSTAPSQLESLLKTLENPAETERLINQLRTLLEVRDRISKTEIEPGLSPPIPVAQAPAPFKKLSEWAGGLHARPKEYIQAFWALASQWKKYLTQGENLVPILKVGFIIFLALSVALWIRYRLLKGLKNIIDQTPPIQALTPWAKVRQIGAQLGVEALSIMVAVVLAMAVSGLIGWRNRFSFLLLFLVGMLSLYWFVLSLVQKLTSLEEPAFRLLPCGDQTSRYLALWARRLLLYGIFAYAPLWVMEWAGWEGDVIQGLHMAYRLGWIALIGLLLFQLKDRVAPRIPRMLEGKTPYTKLIVNSINWILPGLYPVLVLFLLFILAVGAIGYSDQASFLLARAGISLLIIGLGMGIWAISNFLFRRLSALGERIRTRFPGLDMTTNRYINSLHFSLKAALTFFAVVLVLQAWGIDLLVLISTGMVARLLGRILVVAFTVAIAFFVIQVTQLVVARLLADKTDAQGRVISVGKRGKTFIPLINNMVRYTTYFIAGVIILEQLGVNTGPILAGAGIVGLAVGFGAQTLIKDILTGCFIILEDSISVGDVVTIKGTGGLVEAVNLRTIKLRDLSGNVHMIPNSHIDMITNMTKEYSRYVLDVGVAYREDVDEVIQVLKEIDSELRKDPAYEQDILQPLEILGVEEFGPSQVTIRTRITTKPLKQWDAAREIRRRIKKRFDELGIEIPFPHLTLYIGDPKRQPPQPLVIKLQGEAKGLACEGEHSPENQSTT